MAKWTNKGFPIDKPDADDELYGGTRLKAASRLLFPSVDTVYMSVTKRNGTERNVTGHTQLFI